MAYPCCRLRTSESERCCAAQGGCVTVLSAALHPVNISRFALTGACRTAINRVMPQGRAYALYIIPPVKGRMMNKAITDAILFQPLPFLAGLGVWSSSDGTPGSDT
jgi:hypothetical protein